MNLLDFDDTETPPAAGGSAPGSAVAATNKALPALASNENGMSLTLLLPDIRMPMSIR